MSEAVRLVEDEVRELIRRSGLDPARQSGEVGRLVREAVTDYDERSIHGGMPTLGDLGDAVKSVLDAVAGYGPLQRYFDDPQVEEIKIDVLTRRGGARPRAALAWTRMGRLGCRRSLLTAPTACAKCCANPGSG